MNFKDAHAKLQEIAAGRYNAIKYEIITPKHGGYIRECSLYIDGYSHYNGSSWEMAFEKLAMAMEGNSVEIEEIEEI